MTTQLQQQRPVLPRASGTSATSSSPASSLHQSFSNVTLRKEGDRQAAHPQPRLGAPTLLCPHVAEVTRRGKQANLGPPACLRQGLRWAERHNAVSHRNAGQRVSTGTNLSRRGMARLCEGLLPAAVSSIPILPGSESMPVKALVQHCTG